MPAWLVKARTSSAAAKLAVMATVAPTRLGLSESVIVIPGSIGAAGAPSVKLSALLEVVITGAALVGVGVTVDVAVAVNVGVTVGVGEFVGVGGTGGVGVSVAVAVGVGGSVVGGGRVGVRGGGGVGGGV